MKKIFLFAGAATLAACTPNDGDDAAAEDAADDTAMVEDAAAEGPGMVGTYTVYNPDGEMMGTAVHNADGTFTWDGADGEDGSGTWENRDGMMCADATEAEGEEDEGPRCWTPGETDENGRMVWTSDDEEPIVAHTEYTGA